MYYNFILNMWMMNKINELKVQSYVSKSYITQVEADMILATPQGVITESSVNVTTSYENIT